MHQAVGTGPRKVLVGSKFEYFVDAKVLGQFDEANTSEHGLELGQVRFVTFIKRTGHQRCEMIRVQQGLCH